MSSHEVLAAASNDRKARLAQLKSLKRKQAPTDDTTSDDVAPSESTSTAVALTHPESDDITKKYLSGRNFDSETRNVKLGFEATPIADPTSTLEYKAEQLALESKKAQEEEKVQNAQLDLFKLQPKKPNWDLKRDLEERMRPLNVRTENAIVRLMRERIENNVKERKAVAGASNENGEGQEVGMEGSELVEAMHLKEKEEEEDRKRDEEDEDVS
ncbi:cell cycle control protein Cwf18 [Corynespora cassiicola Philippines]|uniref:Cell cycle control protein Cwf18 n=1 Tax=Corynespora cassiicola Philippines TaxID=1448308 RepID=A0A2T2NEN7_CORCC|nr:cell cycle control protein Cwf18 [Corynespora cassiicola Philippines]